MGLTKVDCRIAYLPLLFALICKIHVETPRKIQHVGHDMCVNVVIEDAAHIRNDDVTVDQRLVIVSCFGTGLRRLDPLQLLGALK